MASLFIQLFEEGGGGGDDEHKLPPGSPPMRTWHWRLSIFGKLDLTNSTEKFEGPWFTTQLTISLSIGLTSFFLFSYCRTRWPLIFAPRTKLKGGDNRVPSRDYTD